MNLFNYKFSCIIFILLKIFIHRTTWCFSFSEVLSVTLLLQIMYTKLLMPYQSQLIQWPSLLLESWLFRWNLNFLILCFCFKYFQNIMHSQWNVDPLIWFWPFWSSLRTLDLHNRRFGCFSTKYRVWSWLTFCSNVLFDAPGPIDLVNLESVATLSMY